MKMPWTNQTGLAKAAAIFATLSVISLGLCGANFFAVMRYVPLGGSGSPAGWRDGLGNLLTVTGVLELLGIAIGLAGLITVGIAAALKRARRNGTDSRND